MTFWIAKDEVAYSMLIGEKRAKGHWGINELIPDEVKALMYEYREFEENPPPKTGPEKAEELRAMFQRWREESPEGYDEEVMAVLRREMPHKFSDGVKSQ
jgi:hypothetical protein